MKAKKLIAVAIATALTLSSVGMTAFAGSYSDFSSVPGHTDTAGKIAINWKVLCSDGSTVLWTEQEGVYETTLSNWENGYTIQAKNLGLSQSLIFGASLRGYSDSISGTPVSIDSFAFTDDVVDENGNVTFYVIYGDADTSTLLQQAELVSQWAIEEGQYIKENPAIDSVQKAHKELTWHVEEAEELLKKIKERTDYAEYSAETENVAALLEEAKRLKAEAEAAMSAASDPDPVVAKDADGNEYKKSEVTVKLGSVNSNDKEKIVALVSGSNPYAFDVSIYKGDQKLNWISGNNITVTIDNPYPGKIPSNIKLYHMIKDGDNWKADRTISGSYNETTNKIIFIGSDFSPYVLTANLSDAASSSSSSHSSSISGVTTTKNPSTGEFGVIPVVFLAVAALGAAGVVGYRKRTSAAE